MKKNFNEQIAILGGNGNHDLDRKIVELISKLIHHKLRFLHLNMDIFPDEEDNFKIEENETLKNKHVIIFQSIFNKDLKEEFITLIWAAKNQYEAKTVTGVVPFMMYRRQDHPRKDEINRNLMFIQNMKWNGLDRLVLCDIHSTITLDNCKKVGIKAWEADPSEEYAYFLAPEAKIANSTGIPYIIFAPDVGSIERALRLKGKLETHGVRVTVVVSPKKRLPTGEIELITNEKELEILRKKYKNQNVLFGDEHLVGAYICIRDDEVSTGGTAYSKGWYLRKNMNIKHLSFGATHPVCTPGWKTRFSNDSPFDQVYFGNTIPRGYKKATGGKIITIDMAPIIANTLIDVIIDIFSNKK